MSQVDLSIDPATQGGAALDAALDLWKLALYSNHAGAARPAYAVQGMTWVKTVSATSHEVYYFDGTDDILLATVNPTANTFALTTIGSIFSNSTNAVLNPTTSPVNGFSWDATLNRFVINNNSGDGLLLSRFSSDGVVVRTWRNNVNVGSISVTTTATTYATSSDYRLKYDIENIGFTFEPDEDIPGPLGKLMRLKPSKYRMHNDNGAAMHYGFIAHELQAEAPEAVTGFKDATEEQDVIIGYHDDPNGGDPLPVTERRQVPVYQGVDASQLIALLTASIQQLTRRVLELETR